MTTCMHVSGVVQFILIQHFLFTFFFCKSIVSKIQSQGSQRCNRFANVRLVNYRFFKQACELLARHNPPKAANSSFFSANTFKQPGIIQKLLAVIFNFGSAYVWQLLCTSRSRLCNRSQHNLHRQKYLVVRRCTIYNVLGDRYDQSYDQIKRRN